VKSWEKTATGRPLMVPCPVTTASPGILRFSIPKSWQSWMPQPVELYEAAFVQQDVDALAGGQLARLVLLGDGSSPPPSCAA